MMHADTTKLARYLGLLDDGDTRPSSLVARLRRCSTSSCFCTHSHTNKQHTGTRTHTKMLATPLNHRVCHLFSSCRWLEGNRGWFLVLDDAHDPSVLNALKLPKCGSILITAPDVSGWDAAVGWQVGPRTIDGQMSGNCTQNTVQVHGLESCLKEANRDLFAEHGRTRKF